MPRGDGSRRPTINHEHLAASPLDFLAISGSLRASSSNTSVLRAFAALAPESVRITLYGGLGTLPHFNPDLETDAPPPEVVELRSRLREADAVLICIPEYAHGVPGALKNALDWVVGSGELMHKPVALLNASFASTHGHASLAETLLVMMAQVTSTRVPLTTNRLGPEGILSCPNLVATLHQVLATTSEMARAASFQQS